MRAVASSRLPLLAEVSCVGPFGSSSGWSLRPDVQWACEQCLDSGTAVVATRCKQRYCDYPPYLAYFDRKRQCVDCKREFTFAATEQRHWYETLRFWVQAKCVRCPACRAEDRRRAAAERDLATAVRGVATNEPQGLVRIAELHAILGNIASALEYFRRARNLCPTGPHRAAIEQAIESLSQPGGQ
jgi:hypothetical protein